MFDQNKTFGRILKAIFWTFVFRQCCRGKVIFKYLALNVVVAFFKKMRIILQNALPNWRKVTIISAHSTCFSIYLWGSKSRSGSESVHSKTKHKGAMFLITFQTYYLILFLKLTKYAYQ